MDTIDEVFQSMSQEDAIDVRTNIEYLIDNELRIITVPQNGVVLGVEGDKDVNAVHFKMPRMYRGLDLGDGFNIRVNYANAKAELGYFAVVRPDVTEDSISFEWLLGSHALMYVGEIKFAVSLIKSSVDGRIEKKFNTTLGKAQCLTGLDVDVSVPEEDIYDLLTQIKQDVMADIQPSLDGAKADAAAAKQSATQAAESATTATTGAENVRLGVETVNDAVKIAEQTSAHVDEVKTAVEASATAASGDAAKAEAAKTAAATAQGKAEAAKTSAEQFKMAAEQAKNDATAQAQAAAQSAEAANQAKTEASMSKTAAAESAKQAKVSQDAASTSAQTASTKAEEAKTSADAAKVSETNAKAAENAAASIVENAKIVSDNVLKGEETATLINVTDAWPSKPRGMKIYGQSNQLTTTGKNQVDHTAPLNAYGDGPFKGVQLDNGFILDSLTDSDGTKRIATMNVLGGIKAGDTIIVSCDYKRLSGDIERPSIYLADEPQEYGIGINKPYTAKNNHSLVGVYLDVGTNSKMEITDVQLIKGSTQIAYEPYTGGKPSPSPEYPQEITNLNKAELVVASKNLINPNRLAQINSSIYQVVNGQLKVIMSDNTAWDDVPIYGTLQAGTYTVSGDNIEIRDAALNQIVNSISTHAMQFTLKNPTAIKMKIGFALPEYPVISKAQLEVGSKVTTYEPYKSKSTAIDVQGNELCSLPNGVKDEVVIDAEGNVSLIKRVAKIQSDNMAELLYKVYPADENGNLPYAIANFNDDNDFRTNEVRCNVRPTGNLKMDKSVYATWNALVVVDTRFTDLETVKQILKSENGIYYYETTPQTIPLGKVELPALPEATSNVWNDGNIPANVYIQYLKDVNIAYSDLENQIKQITTALSVATLKIATK